MKPNTAGRADGNPYPVSAFAHTLYPVAGLISGAVVLTLKGERAVHEINVGDKVITRDRGAVPVTQIDSRSQIVSTVEFRAGSLGHFRFDLDVILAAHQTVFLRDWRAQAFCGIPRALVMAKDLIDDEFVTDNGQQAMTLHKIYCATPQIIYANGLELGTPDAEPHARRARAA